MMKFTIEDNASLQQATNLTATELLEVVTELTDASAEMQALVGEVKEMDLVLENIRHAHNTLVDIGASAEALAVLDIDGNLGALAQVQTDMESVAALSGKALEAVATKIDAALEEQKEGLWARFKAWCKKVFAAIRRFFGTIWTWLKGLFGHGKLLSWKEAKVIYDCTSAMPALEKAITVMFSAFAGPSEMAEVRKSLREEMNKIYEDDKARAELLKHYDEVAKLDAAFGSASGGGTPGQESLNVVGFTQNTLLSYAGAKQLFGIFQGTSVYDAYGTALSVAREVEGIIGKSDEELAALRKELDNELEGFGKVVNTMARQVDQVGTLKCDFDTSVPKIDMTFTCHDNSNKTPAQLGWNLKSCREFMKNFGDLINTTQTNGLSVVTAAEKSFSSTLDKLDAADMSGPNATYVKTVIRVSVGFMLDDCKLANTSLRLLTLQAKYITRVYAIIISELRRAARAAKGEIAV